LAFHIPHHEPVNPTSWSCPGDFSSAPDWSDAFHAPADEPTSPDDDDDEEVTDPDHDERLLRSFSQILSSYLFSL
jgi:hypothetical protein